MRLVANDMSVKVKSKAKINQTRDFFLFFATTGLALDHYPALEKKCGVMEKILIQSYLKYIRVVCVRKHRRRQDVPLYYK